MKTKETKTEFINRVMGLNFKSIQGKYSFCNDERRHVLFSLDLRHGEDSNLILDKPKNGSYLSSSCSWQ
jgi:5-methylcytosine-specific restriction protein A